jgi:hypothetical protein
MVINPTEVVNLPLNGRDPADLALVVPGVNKSFLEIEGATSREASYNVNGLRNQVNSFLLDGLDNSSWSLNDLGFSNQRASSAPMRYPNSVLPLAIRARSSAKRPVAWSTKSRARNQRIPWRRMELPAQHRPGCEWAIPPANGEQPALIQNQFGADVGGPILREKIFLFGDYEGFRRILRTALQATLPTAAQAAGQFVDAKRKCYSHHQSLHEGRLL